MNKRKYPFTQEEVRQAYQTSVVDLARQYGYELKSERNVFKIPDMGGLYIWQNGLGWYNHSSGEKGNNVDFLMKYCGVASKSEAIRMLLVQANITPVSELSINSQPLPPKGEINLPEKFNGKYSNLYWYLMTKRCIDKDVVYKCLSEGSIYQDIRRNVVFCGKDNAGAVRYACLRGTYEAEGRPAYKGEVFNSDKSYGFSMDGTSDRLFVFEAPIDAMSHASIIKLAGLDWRKDNRLALGGTSDRALNQYLNDHGNIRQVIFCLDNDYCKWDKAHNQWSNIGQNAVLTHAEKLKGKYLVGRSMPPLPYKDYNDYLVGIHHPETADELKQKAYQSFSEHDSLDRYNELFPSEEAPVEVAVPEM